MFSSRAARYLVIGALGLSLSVSLAACGRGGSGIGSGDSRIGSGDSRLFGGGSGRSSRAARDQQSQAAATRTAEQARGKSTTGSTIWDLFKNNDDPNTTVEVNKYIWNASLDVLNFLPIQSVDPFTGVIVTGYGRPPGGGRAYRATVYVQDPALDARSLKVALESQGGGSVSPDTVRAVEDAILTRARQLRIADSKL